MFVAAKRVTDQRINELSGEIGKQQKAIKIYTDATHSK